MSLFDVRSVNASRQSRLGGFFGDRKRARFLRLHAPACRSVICALVLIVEGCATAVGSLPRPGLFTFYFLTDTSHMLVGSGKHSTNINDAIPPRGIIYTTHAGFLDLAHIYNTALTAYEISLKLDESLASTQHFIDLPAFDDSKVRLAWISSHLSAEDSRTVSRRLSECVAFDLMTWHEIITWFGYETTHLWTEKPSAFTYDDTMSHVIGIDVFIQMNGSFDKHDFNRVLRDVMKEAGLVDRHSAARAVDAVKGKWWGPKLYIRRMIDVGENDGIVTPWLVPGMDDGGQESTRLFMTPCRNLAGRYSLVITPSNAILRKIQRSIPGYHAAIDTQTDFPFLLEVVRHEVRHELGERATEPN